MKKRIWVLLILLGVIVIGVGSFLLSRNEKNNIDAINNTEGNTNIVNNSGNNKETSTTSVKRDEYIPAKAEGFSSLEEMENASECIVRVKKESEDVIPSGTDTTGHTMAQVRIQEIFQNTLGDAIQKDKIIEIWENDFRDGDGICH